MWRVEVVNHETARTCGHKYTSTKVIIPTHKDCIKPDRCICVSHPASGGFVGREPPEIFNSDAKGRSYQSIAFDGFEDRRQLRQGLNGGRIVGVAQSADDVDEIDGDDEDEQEDIGGYMGGRVHEYLGRSLRENYREDDDDIDPSEPEMLGLTHGLAARSTGPFAHMGSRRLLFGGLNNGVDSASSSYGSTRTGSPSYTGNGAPEPQCTCQSPAQLMERMRSPPSAPP